MTSRLRRVVYMLLAASMLASCAYSVPYAILVVMPRDSTEAAAVKAGIADFGRRYGLTMRRPYPSSADSLGGIQKYITVYISDDGPFYFTVYSPPTNCLVIKLIEQKRDWTRESLIGLVQLQDALSRIVGERSRLATDPAAWETSDPGEAARCPQAK